MNISLLLPVIATIGSVFIVIALIIVRGMERREGLKRVDIDRFNSFVEEMKKENAQMHQDIQTVKEKVEAIDQMMKDI